MRLRSLSGFAVVSVLVASALGSACGSDPEKKRAQEYEAGGEGGVGGDATGTSGTAGTGNSAAQAGNGATDGGTSATDGGAATQPHGGAGAETSGGEAGAGGAPSAEFHGLYIGPTGVDTADGTLATPFATLARAASMAQSGDTIVFLDGTYTLGAVAATSIPDGVDLMAQHTGAATLTGSGDLLKLAGSTRIQGLEFKSFGHVVTFADGADATGRLTIEDTSFVNCSVACMDLPGAVEATVTSATDAVVGNGGNGFALLTKTAKLKMNGGILQAFGATGVIRATDDASVSLSDVQVLDGTGWVLVADKKSVAVLDGLTAATQSQGIIQQKGQSTVTVTNSDLSMRAGTPYVYMCFSLEMDGLGSLTVEDSNLHACNCGFKGVPPADLTISGTDVHDMGYGIDLDGGGSAIGGALSITDSKFRAVTVFAMRTASDGALMDINIRGSLFSGGTTGVAYHTVYLKGASASTLDLGTGASPGGNTFLSFNPSYSGLWIGVNAGTTLASGNTWTPNAQDADGAGHYSAGATAGAKLDITSVTPGQNYAKPYTGTLRLAQNP